MVWVRSEYAGELAVLSAWLSALIPWNVTYSVDIAGGDILFVRFPFFQIRYAWGVPLAKGVSVMDPLSAMRFQQGQSLEAAYAVWAAGAAVLGVAVLFAVAYYALEERIEASRLDPVLTIGVLLVVAGAVLAYATYRITDVFPGTPIPVGVVFLFVLGAVLLQAERR